jgi:integrase/recombinase XerD
MVRGYYEVGQTAPISLKSKTIDDHLVVGGENIKERRSTTPMDVTVVIARFKEVLAARGYSESTVTIYGQNLSLFNRWLKAKAIGDLKQITAKVIADYQADVRQRKVAEQTKALYLRPVKRLFEYLVESNQLLINPAEGIKEIDTTKRKLAPVLSRDLVKRLLDQPNLSTTTGLRDRAVLEVLYATAIRRGELLNLCVYDAELADKVLYIRKGKGRVQRVVPMTKTAISYTKEYITRIRPRWAKKMPKQRKLFLTNTGKALNGSALQALIRKYRLEAGIKMPVSANTLRRSCATHMLRRGADIRYVQALLGHRHLRTTQRYTRVAAADIKQTHNKTHPGKGL